MTGFRWVGIVGSGDGGFESCQNYEQKEDITVAVTYDLDEL